MTKNGTGLGGSWLHVDGMIAKVPFGTAEASSTVKPGLCKGKKINNDIILLPIKLTLSYPMTSYDVVRL